MAKEKGQMTEAEEEQLRNNPINVFSCGHKDCEKLDAMVFEEFKHHLFTVHNLKADQLKGRKKMMSHIDGAQWHSSNYEWNLEVGLTFYQHITMARDKDDMMRFEY